MAGDPGSPVEPAGLSAPSRTGLGAPSVELPPAPAAPAATVHEPAPRRGRTGAIAGLAYPFELVAAYMLAIFFVSSVSVWAEVRSFVFAMLVVAVVMAAFWAFLRDVDRAAVGTLAVMVLLILGKILLPLALLFALIVFLLDRLRQTRVSSATLSRWFAVFSTILLVTVLVRAGQDGTLGLAMRDLNGPGGLPADNGAQLVDPQKPDIYVLLLDGYGRADTLQAASGFDNSTFLDALRTRGFDVSKGSNSNYQMTGLTFASMLDMRYVTEIPALAGIGKWDSKAEAAFHDVLNKNAGFDALHSSGYQIVTTDSGWEQLSLRGGDVFLDDGAMTDFEARQLQYTLLGAAIEKLLPSFPGDQFRTRARDELAAVRTVARTRAPQPRFVLSHVLSPHPPFAFGKNGEGLPLTLSETYDFDWDSPSTQSATLYRDQLEYVNTMVLPVVDDIIKSARRPTVVVLMSDHGARVTCGNSLGSCAEANANFFAALTPGHPALFGADPTPVNLLPTLLDTYLGGSVTVQPDRCFGSEWQEPTQMHELACDGPTVATR